MKIEAKCKICRRLGQKLLWNERCASGKCALSRRRVRPGMHGYKPRTLSDYARQLIEKQKLRYFYILKENQLKNIFEKAKKLKEPLPSAIIKILESKLDIVIWRLGYTSSKLQARQLVNHGHFLVNGEKVNIPTYFLKPGDIIEIKPKSKNLAIFKDLNKKLKSYQIPSWLKINFDNLTGEFNRYPELEEVNLPFDIQLALQLYGK
jgi:small subunit ribosomal protein S4